MPRKVPVYLEPSKERKIVVFGGGPVALRKCRQFEGFFITAVADNFVSGLEDICDSLVHKHFSPEEIPEFLDGCFIAVAATDSEEINSSIVRYAKERGIPVNSAHGGGDILLPSVVRKRHYSVAVSSEGSVPAFPPYVAAKIDRYLGPEYDLMMEVLTSVRKNLKTAVPEQTKRAKLLAEILDSDDIWNMLQEGCVEDAVAAAEDIEARYFA